MVLPYLEIAAVLIAILLIIITYVEYVFRGVFDGILEKLKVYIPPLGNGIETIGTHIASADIIGVLLFGFLSKLFFLPLPSEPYLLYAYGRGFNPFLLVFLTTIAGIAGSVVSYWLGVIFGNRILKTKDAKWLERVRNSRFVGLLIFGTAVAPIPDFASVIFGTVHVGLKRFVIYTFAGSLIKNVLLVFAIDYLSRLVGSIWI